MPKLSWTLLWLLCGLVCFFLAGVQTSVIINGRTLSFRDFGFLCWTAAALTLYW